LLFVSVVAGVALLGLPGAAGAAAPVCDDSHSLYQLPAGLTWLNPRAPCADADGDAIWIEVVDKPDFGTLDPDGAKLISIDKARFYTAKPDAAGSGDKMTFIAHAGGERSKPFSVEVWNLPTHTSP
jgi:hypothetical protein